MSSQDVDDPTSMENVNETLNALENQYRSDLAVHLYSARLARRVDRFPKDSWVAWPLHINQVPFPVTKYVDGVVDYSENPSDTAYDPQDTDGGDPQTENAETIQQTESGDIGTSRYIEITNPGDPVLHYENSQPRPISVNFRPKGHTSSKEALVNAIHALVQRRVAARFRKLKKKTRFKSHELIPDTHTPETVNMSKIVARKVDMMLTNAAAKFKTAKNSGLIGWQQVLLAGLATEDIRHTTFRPGPYRSLYNRCESLLDDIRYPYEVEGKESGKRFDVAAHINEVYGEKAHFAHLRRRSEYKNKSDNYRVVFEKQLALRASVEELRWDMPAKKRARYGIKALDWDELRYNAVRHGPINIDQEMYLLDY